jgi:hypothetical protein
LGWIFFKNFRSELFFLGFLGGWIWGLGVALRGWIFFWGARGDEQEDRALADESPDVFQVPALQGRAEE